MAVEALTLLDKVRNFLDITWEDSELDNKLVGIIGRGIAYIDRIAGRDQTYQDNTPAMGLLLNYCLYEQSNQLSEFQRNYLHELNALQLDEGSEALAAAQTTP
ncbi:MAG: hypothetical protein ACOX7B_03315 [Christensenellales bacterium]|jgi:hypothetical protein